MAERVAVCPGTYDPVTVGHLDIIRRAAAMFDRVVVGVVRPPRHKQTMFPLEERIGFIEESLDGRQRGRWRDSPTLVVEFARGHGATAIVKGLRAVSDFEWEFQMNNLNRGLAAEIETMYLMARRSTVSFHPAVCARSRRSADPWRVRAGAGGPAADGVARSRRPT